MRGKKAKRLRKGALDICRAQGVIPGENAGQYHQVKNCHAWVNAGDKHPITGEPVLRHVLNPGTIIHKNPFMRVYRALKKIIRKGKRS